jgi:hypothetical protein
LTIRITTSGFQVQRARLGGQHDRHGGCERGDNQFASLSTNAHSSPVGKEYDVAEESLGRRAVDAAHSSGW